MDDDWEKVVAADTIERWKQWAQRLSEVWRARHREFMLTISRGDALTQKQVRDGTPTLSCAQASCQHASRFHARGANQYAEWVICHACRARISYKSKFDERSHVKEQDVKNLAPKARVTRKDVWPNLMAVG